MIVKKNNNNNRKKIKVTNQGLGVVLIVIAEKDNISTIKGK